MVLKKKYYQMEFINPALYGRHDEKLPLITGFVLVVDGIALFTLGLKSEGWKRLTEGDIVTIAVLLTFTVLIIIADLWYIFARKEGSCFKSMCQRKQVLYGHIGTTNIGETCSICLESIRHDTVQIQCGHVFHKKCIESWIDKDQLSCPLCRTQLVPIKRHLINFNVMHFVRSIKGSKDKSKGIVSIV